MGNNEAMIFQFCMEVPYHSLAEVYTLITQVIMKLETLSLGREHPCKI
jgi:hypothetical protein